MKHCEDHSGFVMWQRGIAVLITYAAALLSYSVFWQAPAIKQNLADHINNNKLENQETDNRLKNLEKRTEVLEIQVKKIMALR